MNTIIRRLAFCFTVSRSLVQSRAKKRRTLGAASLTLLFAGLAAQSIEGKTQPLHQKGQAMQNNPYVGMWITKDGYIRHELLPNGRYDEARGSRKSAYQGRYEISGNHIEYWDDTGFTADGDFENGVLYHAGMVLYREQTQK